MTTDTERAPFATRPCPACPDGNRWTTEGPMGTCPVCGGYAVVKMTGQAFTKAEWREVGDD